MKIEAGYDITFNSAQEVPIVLMLSVHPSRKHDLLTDHRIELSPEIKSRDYLDAFGNICTRLVAPPGVLEIRNRFILADGGLPDEVAPEAARWEIDQLPDEALVYLLASRYCDRRQHHGSSVTTENPASCAGPNVVEIATAD